LLEENALLRIVKSVELRVTMLYLEDFVESECPPAARRLQ